MILIQQMLRGDIDGIDIEPSVVNHHLDKLGKRGLIQIDKRFTFEVYAYYLSTIKHGPVIIQFNQFLKDNNVWLEQLRKKFKIVDHRPYLKQKSPEYPGL
jgi:DNA-binding transcriptional ArsR family regulator